MFVALLKNYSIGFDENIRIYVYIFLEVSEKLEISLKIYQVLVMFV